MREGLTPLTLKVFGDGFVTYVLASGEAFIVVDPALREVVERALVTITRTEVRGFWEKRSPNRAAREPDLTVSG